MRAWAAVLTVPAALVALIDTYLALLTVLASFRARARSSGVAEPAGEPVGRARGPHRFAVLVPAHDEEGGLGPTIDSIVTQEYPGGHHEVHVVADNCTDRTASVARAHGAEAHERSDLSAPGKGPALGWLVERLLARQAHPDAFVVIDADTAMMPGFLQSMDDALARGGVAWQGYYTVRDPSQSPATALRYAALVLRHYVRPLGRTALGGSCSLFGNGMVFRAGLLAERRFSAHLTEDAEFQLDLLLDGDLVGFVADAVVEAEMPTTLDAARTQNERWELGRVQLARRFLPALVARAAKPGPHRVAYADAALDQLVPPLSVLAAGTSLVAMAAVATRRRGLSGLGLVAAGGLAVHVLGGLAVARVPRATYVALLRAPRFVAWKVGLWGRVMLRPDRVTWIRTRRNDE